MTKKRPPLSFELALTKVAGLIGWEKCAEILDVSARAVRNWSDPDAASGIRLDAAEKLDIAYQQAGGAGAPFLECYSTRLKSRLANTFGSAESIAHTAALAAKESGEAIAASIEASRPDACDKVYARAEGELEEGIESMRNTLALVRSRRTAERDLDTMRSEDA